MRCHRAPLPAHLWHESRLPRDQEDLLVRCLPQVGGLRARDWGTGSPLEGQCPDQLCPRHQPWPQRGYGENWGPVSYDSPKRAHQDPPALHLGPSGGSVTHSAVAVPPPEDHAVCPPHIPWWHHLPATLSQYLCLSALGQSPWPLAAYHKSLRGLWDLSLPQGQYFGLSFPCSEGRGGVSRQDKLLLCLSLAARPAGPEGLSLSWKLWLGATSPRSTS